MLIIREISLDGPQHSARDDYQPLARRDTHIRRQPTRVCLCPIPPDDRDIAILQLPDVRAVFIVV
jgi:hypothetical protein